MIDASFQNVTPYMCHRPQATGRVAYSKIFTFLKIEKTSDEALEFLGCLLQKRMKARVLAFTNFLLSTVHFSRL